ncbi:MAG: hypothetical protein U1E92_03400 [Moraxella osloensis]
MTSHAINIKMICSVWALSDACIDWVVMKWCLSCMVSLCGVFVWRLAWRRYTTSKPASSIASLSVFVVLGCHPKLMVALLWSRLTSTDCTPAT